MPHPTQRDYSHQDLRNRSFKKQDLTGANFSYSDLRGCNFQGATLTEANFQHCRTGQSHRQIIICTAIAISINVVAVAIASCFGKNDLLLIGFVVSLVILTEVTNIVGRRFNIQGAFAGGGSVVSMAAASSAFSRRATSEGIRFSIFSLILLGITTYCFLKWLKLMLAAIGTDFGNTQLCHADFSDAKLQNTDFSSAQVEGVVWNGSRCAKCKFPPEAK